MLAPEIMLHQKSYLAVALCALVVFPTLAQSQDAEVVRATQNAQGIALTIRVVNSKPYILGLKLVDQARITTEHGSFTTTEVTGITKQGYTEIDPGKPIIVTLNVPGAKGCKIDFSLPLEAAHMTAPNSVRISNLTIGLTDILKSIPAIAACK